MHTLHWPPGGRPETGRPARSVCLYQGHTPQGQSVFTHMRGAASVIQGLLGGICANWEARRESSIQVASVEYPNFYSSVP